MRSRSPSGSQAARRARGQPSCRPISAPVVARRPSPASQAVTRGPSLGRQPVRSPLEPVTIARPLLTHSLLTGRHVIDSLTGGRFDR
jgi:hypothetical protein